VVEYRHLVEMQQIIEMLAEMKAERKAEREKMAVKLETIRDKMKAMHGKIDANQEELKITQAKMGYNKRK
jgi:uncharacterized coiled-coil protein SlyX